MPPALQILDKISSGSFERTPPFGRWLTNDGGRQFMPDESGNYKSSLAIVIITFLVSTEAWFVKAS
jgi:hypothetical protein